MCSKRLEIGGEMKKIMLSASLFIMLVMPISMSATSINSETGGVYEFTTSKMPRTTTFVDGTHGIWTYWISFQEVYSGLNHDSNTHKVSACNGTCYSSTWVAKNKFVDKKINASVFGNKVYWDIK